MPTLKELANTIRMLTVDAIQKANSGHPGMPLGMADIATVLWREFLRHDPANPKWHNRDRFIISNGHGSMLLYSLLHLTGYGLTVSDIKQFRQLHSKTPGHPEYGVTVGVETTTGPLAQGLSNGVGMAIAEKIMAATFNRPGFEIIDHYTYVFAGDGCLMEGLSHEACSLAGTHRLGKLIVFWDDNKISIDGDTDGWFTDSTPERFRAYNWHVVADVDGHDFDSIRAAIKEARDVKDKPTLICCKTIIGYGAPNLCGLHDCHGSPLGTVEVSATRKNLNWPYTPFVIPNEFYEAWDARQAGRKNSLTWMQLFNSYKQNFPELAAEFTRRIGEKLPDGWPEKTRLFIHNSNNDPQSIATRQASQRSLNFYTELLPEIFGGSADLTGSNLTNWNKSIDLTPENPNGNYMHYGVREFGMCGIMSGIALHGGLLPFGGTFLVFTDYARNAIRLAAMMKKRVIYVLSHDSIGLGEDGPTHQPVEHLTMLRATPNLSLWRPCDDIETATAWKMAIERTTGPTCLVLSRQKVPHQNRTPAVIDNIKRGGYILVDCEGRPELILIATGSEVSLAVSACYKLTAMGKKIRVVSLPSTDVFDAQDEPYKESVLPQRMTKRIAIEAASADYWYKYVGFNGKIIGMHTFGESAPAAEIYKYLKITEENIVETALGMIEKAIPVV
jgi:transketolase